MSTCIICGKNDFILLYNKTLKKCSNCGFITANLDISEEKLKEYYSENYFKGEEYLDYIADKDVIQYNFKKRLKKICKTKSSVEINNVLEIGCAYGFFGDELRKNLTTVDYKGIDVSEDAVKYGANELKLKLQAISYLDLPAPEKKYSDVFMWDVIEHLQKPHEFIAKLSNEIKAGGNLYITTGDISRMLPKIQKSKWRLIHPPTHLHYFSKKTLSKLLKDNGFEVKNISYPPIYRSISQIFYSLFLLNKKEKAWKTKLFNKISKEKYLKMNTYDIMFVIARKV